jgi:hypothetical protein
MGDKPGKFSSMAMGELGEVPWRWPHVAKEQPCFHLLVYDGLPSFGVSWGESGVSVVMDVLYYWSEFVFMGEGGAV